MNKFTFRLKDRMKVTVEKVSPRVCLFVVSGKTTHTFRFSTKKAKELIKLFTSVSTYGCDMSTELVKCVETQTNGKLYLKCSADFDYTLMVFCNNNKLILDTTFSKKTLKKMYRTMIEVYESDLKE